MSDNATPAVRDDALLAVRYLLSRIVGQANLCRNSWPLCRLVEQLTLGAGENRRPEAGWPTPEAACRRLGLSREALDARWRLVTRTPSPLLGDEVLAAFVPQRLWPALLDLIREGPELAFMRVEVALRELVDGVPSEDGRARPFSAGSIDSMQKVFRGLARELNTLRRIEHTLSPTPGTAGIGIFAAWQSSDYPKLESPQKLGARPANLDTSAPPRRFIRLVLRGLDWEVQQRRASGNTSLFYALRNRAMLAVAILGTRPDAFTRMVGGDVIAAYRFPDGEDAPAILVNPRKTLHHSVIRPKALTEQVYLWVKEYIEYAGVEADKPLWLSRINPPTAFAAGSLSAAIARLLDPPADRERRLNPYFRAIGDDWPTRSLTAGKLRHLAEGVAFDAGLDYIIANRAEILGAFHNLPGDPQIFADAVLDHGMGTLSARYKDAAAESGRARYGRIGCLGIYDYLLGDRGARLSVDLQAVAEARRDLTAARTHEATLETEIERIEQRLITTDFHSLSPQERELYLIELVQSQITLARLARELNGAGKRTEKTEAALEAAKTTLTPIDDLAQPATANDIHDPTDDPDAVDEPELPILREYAWPYEFRRAIGENMLSDSTLRRWMAGKLPHRAGDRRNLIEPDAVEKISDRLQRIRLDKLDWTRFPESVQERLDAIRRTPDPRIRNDE